MAEANNAATAATTEATTASTAGQAANTVVTEANTAAQALTEKQDSNVMSTEAIEKYIQSQVDKQLAEERKKNAAAQKELEKLKKEKMTDEELRKYDFEKREKEMQAKEQALLERENRLFAMKAIKEVGLDDGSPQSLDLIDFVMANDEAGITDRVKAFKSLVDRFVNAQVDKTFKANGRTPNAGNTSSADNKNENSFAAELGKKAAETAEKSEKILNHYYKKK